MADSADQLQKALDAVYNYCKDWNLTVNLSKTKVVIFSKGKSRNVNFLFGDQDVEVTDDYVYLGVTFNFNGSFKKAISKQVKTARRALMILIKKI